MINLGQEGTPKEYAHQQRRPDEDAQVTIRLAVERVGELLTMQMGPQHALLTVEKPKASGRNIE